MNVFLFTLNKNINSIIHNSLLHTSELLCVCAHVCVHVCVCTCVPVAQLCLTHCNPWTVAHQAPLSMEYSRQEHWSGLPFLSTGDLFPRTEPTSLVFPTLAGRLFFTKRVAWETLKVINSWYPYKTVDEFLKPSTKF